MARLHSPHNTLASSPRGFAPLPGTPWLTLTWSWHTLVYAGVGGLVALWMAILMAEAVTLRWPRLGLVMAFVPVLVLVGMASAVGALILRRLRCRDTQWCPACLRAMRREAHVCPSCHFAPPAQGPAAVL